MHRASPRKVQRRQLIQPAVRVPRPVRNGAVHDGGPAEGEDERRQDASALEAAARDEHDGAGAEEHLVEAEDDLGEEHGAGRGRGDDVLEAEVCEVADEGVARAGVGEGIPPEHPLETDAVGRQFLGSSIETRRGWNVHAGHG